MLDGIQIRDGRVEDASALLQLFRDHATFEKSVQPPSLDKPSLENLLREKNSFFKCLMIFQNDLAKGYATYFRQFSTWNLDYYLYLDCLYLDKHLRGMRIGHTVMDLVLRYAQKTNCTHVEWQTPAFNKAAIAFYEKLGAQSTNKERFFWTYDSK